MGRPKTDVLTEKETKVLAALKAFHAERPIADLAAQAFGSNKKGESWVRNALRKLIRLRLAKHVGGHRSGLYCKLERQARKPRTAKAKAENGSIPRAKEKTLADRVRWHIEIYGPMSDAELAKVFGKPQPSIRVARAKAGLTKISNGGNGRPLWGVPPSLYVPPAA